MIQTIIIDNYIQLQEFIEDIKDNNVILHPLFINNFKHPIINDLTLLYVYILQKEISYVITFNHLETHTNIPQDKIFELLNSYNTKKYIFDKKQLLHIYDLDNLIDINLLYYFLTNQSYDTKHSLPINTFSHPNINHYSDINKITPIVKLIEQCENYININIDIINKTKHLIDTSPFKYYNDIFLYDLYQIEKSGLYIDINILKEKFGEDSLIQLDNNNNCIYSEYYIYTSTGRPSNRFGGINFAALNKTDGTRDLIYSRFDNGTLLEFDFDAYHLNLIAQLIGYKIPEDMSMHEYLGRQYFQKQDQLTIEEYNKSKDISFKIIYGGYSEEFNMIPYFNTISEFIKILWKEFVDNKVIYAPLTKKPIYFNNLDDMSPSKLFNYYIQLTETEFSSYIIDCFTKLITKYTYKSCLILYTYDSFLFDCNPDEIDYISNIKQIFKEFGFKYKIKIGNIYSKMKLVTFKKEML